LAWIDPATSQRAQIIWHVAELSQHGRIAEIAGSRITSATERDRANVIFLARQRFGTHYRSVGIEALGRLASRNAVIGGDEG
jgi:hypothetical protein